MMSLNKEFAEKFDDLNVIMGPRAMNKGTDVERLERHARTLKEKGVSVLFDPQFYVPDSKLKKIKKYPYFNYKEYNPKDFNNNYAEDFLKSTIDYQLDKLDVNKLILPNIFINSITDDWYRMQEIFFNVILNDNINLEIYHTLALGPDIIKNKDVFDEMISKCINYPINGYYFVLKPPENSYLINDEEYIYSILDAFISLRNSDKDILLGFANQQSLIYASVGVNKIASGNYYNFRKFDPGTFMKDDRDTDPRRSDWYYDGNTLSEYKPQRLTLAYRRGLEKYFGPPSEYSKEFLESDRPSNYNWTTYNEFRHYLVTLRKQWLKFKLTPSKERIDKIIDFLEEKRSIMLELKDKNFKPGNKAFDEEIIDSNLSALEAIKYDRKYDILNL